MACPANRSLEQKKSVEFIRRTFLYILGIADLHLIWKNQENSEEALREIFFRKGFIMLFGPKETGQGLTEYAIIIALVAIIVIAVVRLLGPTIGNTFSSINSSIPS